MRTHAIQTSKAWDGKFYVSIARLLPHHYGKQSAYGERTVLKPGAWQSLGRFPDRHAAMVAARLAILDLGGAA